MGIKLKERRVTGCLLVLFLALNAHGGVVHQELSVEVKKELLEKAHVRSSGLKKRFMNTLQTSLKTNGPKGALGDCKLQAKEIPGAVAKGKYEVGRTSHKLRNPNNRARDWVKPYLSKYQASKEPGKPVLVSLENGRLGYLEPIYMQPFCTTCHGSASQIPEGVRTELSQIYPHDKATGFKPGDFRGVVWMEWEGDLR